MVPVMRTPSLFAMLMLLPVLPLAAEEFKVSALTFDAPKEWKSVEADSPMRKAQFSIPGKAGAGELVFFYFGQGGAGGVEANVQRWFGQFKEPSDKVEAETEKAKAGEHPVTFVSAKGTFLAGPPRGPKTEKPDYRLLGAIIEHPDGAVFAKLTGPVDTVDAATAAFKTMITGAE